MKLCILKKTTLALLCGAAVTAFAGSPDCEKTINTFYPWREKAHCYKSVAETAKWDKKIGKARANFDKAGDLYIKQDTAFDIADAADMYREADDLVKENKTLNRLASMLEDDIHKTKNESTFTIVIYKRLSKVYLRLGKTTDAQKMFDRYVKASKRQALKEFKLHNYRSAGACFEKIVETSALFPNAHEIQKDALKQASLFNQLHRWHKKVLI